MKQKEILLVIVVAIVSATLSVFLSQLIVTSGERNLSAEVVEPISPDFPSVEEAFFNEESVNPTQLIQIGNNNNQQPF